VPATEWISAAATGSKCCVRTRGRAIAPEIVVIVVEIVQGIAVVIGRARVTGLAAAIAPALRIAPRVVATEPREAAIARRPPTVAALVQATALAEPIARRRPIAAEAEATAAVL
jgi:hypothetical protein